MSETNIVLDSIAKFSCAPQCTPDEDGKCVNCGKRSTPHVACLFCEKDGVERYGGVCDEMIITNGHVEVTGPLCGNCHVVVYDDLRESGGWSVVRHAG